MFDLKKAVEEANCACYPHMFSQANSEANQERRAKEIERIAAESMLPGGEFDPFTKENFAEAVRNMPDEEMCNLHAAFLIGGWAVSDIGMRISGSIKEYWKKCALVDAAAKYKD